MQTEQSRAIFRGRFKQMFFKPPTFFLYPSFTGEKNPLTTVYTPVLLSASLASSGQNKTNWKS